VIFTRQWRSTYILSTESLPRNWCQFIALLLTAYQKNLIRPSHRFVLKFIRIDLRARHQLLARPGALKLQNMKVKRENRKSGKCKNWKITDKVDLLKISWSAKHHKWFVDRLLTSNILNFVHLCISNLQSTSKISKHQHTFNIHLSCSYKIYKIHRWQREFHDVVKDFVSCKILRVLWIHGHPQDTDMW